MKFQNLALSCLIFLFFLGLGIFPFIEAKEPHLHQSIPNWVKSNAWWWANQNSSDENLILGIHWLALNKFVELTTDIEISKKTEESVPGWIKPIAGLWTDDKISDEEFVTAIEFLINTNVITLSSPTLDDQSKFREMQYAGYSPLFRTFAYAKDMDWTGGLAVPKEIHFELKPNLKDIYQQISVTPETKQKAVVVSPIFTSTAYSKLGFYDYFNEQCDLSCLQTKIQYSRPIGYSASSNAVKVFKMLGYPIITDIDIDTNPSILQKYDKVILLHNEYVTKTEFDAITEHPNVIYLYPNSLYAQINADYIKETISLVRGHNYPTSEIRNGFGWQYDNSEFEYDNTCEGWEFYEIPNGKMLNCYPENIIYNDQLFLKTIKNL